MAPVSWNGANTLYHKVIKPFVLKHQSQIDKALDKVGEKVDAVAKEGTINGLLHCKLKCMVYAQKLSCLNNFYVRTSIFHLL